MKKFFILILLLTTGLFAQNTDKPYPLLTVQRIYNNSYETTSEVFRGYIETLATDTTGNSDKSSTLLTEQRILNNVFEKTDEVIRIKIVNTNVFDDRYLSADTLGYFLKWSDTTLFVPTKAYINLNYYTKTQVNSLLSGKMAYSDTTSLIPTKPFLSLNYYTKTQLNNGQLDSRYYTESETNTFLNTKLDTLDANGLISDSIATKSNIGHTHVVANITDLQDSLNTKSRTTHNHSLSSLSEKSYNSLTDKPDIPDSLSELIPDPTHGLVTDVEKATWNAKTDSADVNGLITTSLSGYFLTNNFNNYFDVRFDNKNLDSIAAGTVNVHLTTSLKSTYDGYASQIGAKLDTTKATFTMRQNWTQAYNWGNHALGGYADSVWAFNQLALKRDLANHDSLSTLDEKKFSSLTDKPTTLAGYGITNAYTKTQTDSLDNADSTWVAGQLLGKSDISSLSQTTNVLYVDNKRTDTYTEVGTYVFPYKTIMAAMNAITGNSSSNRFCIKIATGAYYTENIAINKDFVTLEGYGETLLSGTITLTAPHFRLKNLKTTGAVNGTYTAAFLAEISDCSVNTGKWTVSCSVSGAYVQISGGTTIWTSDIDLSGVTGVVSCQSGYFEGTHTFTNCYMEIIGFENYNGIINLEAGTEAHIGGALCIGTTVNLKTGATVYIDATSASGITLNNTGGTLILTTESSNVHYDHTISGLTATNVKTAIDELTSSKQASLGFTPLDKADSTDLTSYTTKKQFNDGQLLDVKKADSTGVYGYATQNNLLSYVPKTYLDADTTLTANSDVKIATQKATRAFVDSVNRGHAVFVNDGYFPDIKDIWVYWHSTAGAGQMFLAAGTPGERHFIKKNDAADTTLTIWGEVGEPIDGIDSLLLSEPYQAVTIQFSDSSWHVVGGKEFNLTMGRYPLDFTGLNDGDSPYYDSVSASIKWHIGTGTPGVEWTDVDTATALGTSNVKIPTQNAVKKYVDNAVAAGISDGDKDDITVSGTGTLWNIRPDSVSFAKMQNVSTGVLLGRYSGGNGDIQQIKLKGGLAFSNDSLYVNVITALGYTPYNATNPSNYISSVDSTIFGTHYYINNQGFLKSADIIGKIDYSDSTDAVSYTTKNQFTTGQATKVNYSDSLSIFTTPTQAKGLISDSLNTFETLVKSLISDSLATIDLTPYALKDSVYTKHDADSLYLPKSALNDSTKFLASDNTYDYIHDADTRTTHVMEIKLILDATSAATTDSIIVCIPTKFNGMNLVNADAFVTTASSSGTPTFTVTNVTDATNMLSTNITIDANEYTSYTATTAPVINASYDDVTTGDLIKIKCTTAGTGTKGSGIILVFQKP